MPTLIQDPNQPHTYVDTTVTTQPGHSCGVVTDPGPTGCDGAHPLPYIASPVLPTTITVGANQNTVSLACAACDSATGISNVHVHIVGPSPGNQFTGDTPTVTSPGGLGLYYCVWDVSGLRALNLPGTYTVTCVAVSGGNVTGTGPAQSVTLAFAKDSVPPTVSWSDLHP